ncbi:MULTISPECIES: hypothetical protein [Aminobacterium]|jgi:hypothetical protein|uniref:DUF4412 domain-containing protein n=1 Tax=Aminobacterium colombiense (strain DSM 12261 / ALA-1) TaxID=572547 RepID=D5EDI8_AMICL|nr:MULTISPECIES: hypothetical protein [Aminobacterium]MDD2379758.1 hypothetical protein [Aminobacterium colombiense]ADE56620.1 hypothetical protein Amico_0481 [Aminobacterium colombiense DSM 12261]MDD3767784.1 hypothetical protein [Aminobacterium colombiense]MDD4265931.1 hypothetical protein [Aminobacterium colombiense]MDD4586507.1 hypothetical protein [Aminobacterium colombiense]
MKNKFFKGAIFFVLFVTFIFCYAQEGISKVTPPVKSAHIEYELSGQTVGKKTVFFDSYGKNYYELRDEETTISFGGTKEVTQNKTLFIRTDSYTYNIDLLTNTGTRMKNSDMEKMAAMYSGAMTPEQMKEKGEEMFKEMGGKILGKEKLLGYECVVAEVSGVRTWVYEEHITLKSAMSLGTMEQKEEATLFEVNPSIPSSQFTPPGNIEYEDIDLSSMGMPPGVSMQPQD